VIRLLPGIIDLVLTVVAIVDISLIDNSRVRGLPKWAWILISILLFIVGPLLWFFVGRERLEPRNHGRYATESSSGPAPARSGPRAPDDDPEFLGRLRREQEQAERIRDLERELEKRREADDSSPDDPKPAG
jgi:Phospholipase_D-nuclease N-terminal